MASMHMNSMSYGDAKIGLQSLTKECQALWEENKDMQGRFVNDLSELQRFQLAISQLEQSQRHDQMRHAQQSMHDMQQRASHLYEQLTERRMTLVVHFFMYKVFKNIYLAKVFIPIHTLKSV
jgi:predicted nuclease with TOPRIM domain